MTHTPRSPRPVSLVELITHGYLSESDVLPGGGVNESRRCRAEQLYLETRPATAPHVARHARRPPRVQQPPTPRPPPRPQTARGTSAHVHRIHVRRDAHGSDKIPTRFVFDTCCICFNRTKDHAVVPCFHMCVCRACSERIQRCPICRGPVDRIQRIFV